MPPAAGPAAGDGPDGSSPIAERGARCWRHSRVRPAALGQHRARDAAPESLPGHRRHRTSSHGFTWKQHRAGGTRRSRRAAATSAGRHRTGRSREGRSIDGQHRSPQCRAALNGRRRAIRPGWHRAGRGADPKYTAAADAALDADRLFELELTADALGTALGHARTATEMHWHDDVGRHVGTARKLARELADALAAADGAGNRG